MNLLSEQLKAAGDPHRLKILNLLNADETCACELLAAFDITQPTLSHHMKILCDCGLVDARKDGKWVRYKINRPAADTLMAELKNIFND